MLRPIILISLLTSLLLGAPALAQNADQAGTISLMGTGEVIAVPDMAIVNSGVVTFGKTAREALNANSAAMGQLFDLFNAAGIKERDIQTFNFSVQPQYVYPERRDQNTYPKPPRIAGYQVSNNISVRVRNLDNLGSLLDSAVSVGANQINSITFGVDDTAPLFAGARRAAMADAIAKAELYAAAAGVGLGEIISISEGTRAIAPLRYEVMASSQGAPGQRVPVASGEMTFSKQVSVVWKLVQAE